MATISASALPEATRLAIDRTRLAHERTLMAWVRTATSLISFGFTIYKFFDYLRGQQQIVEQGRIGPRGFALAMIAIGLTALALATIQHRRSLDALGLEYHQQAPRSLATLVAGLVAILGVVGLAAVTLQNDGGDHRRHAHSAGATSPVHAPAHRGEAAGSARVR